ncbi:MAG: Folylpolyglutamate synthetase [Geoglossum simile]|nr:MAG: Folylpolyglutamate synthetase [Geoglossum simile]
MQSFWRSSIVRRLKHLRHLSHRVRIERNYDDAIAALNTLQTNFATNALIRESRRAANEQAIPEMIEWLRRVGYQPSDLNRLNPIHVAGTKGKGSTCAFISSILSQYLSSATSNLARSPFPQRPPISKIGLYTSPHLRSVRERIQINNAPLSEPLFTQYFFEVWDRLETSAAREGHAGGKPSYFRFLTLTAFHAYLREGVDTAIIEVGIGGEHDSTNVIERPTVVGITSLAIDHQLTLGDTIEEITWHKAGIMKPGSPAFTVPQLDRAMSVLKQRAKERNADLTIVGCHPELKSIRLGLDADYQKDNASLAIAIAAAHLRKLSSNTPNTTHLPPEFKRGLQLVRWSGRCEIRREDAIDWYIDGGHTLESIEVAGTWFASKLPNAHRGKRILLFNQQTRDASTLATTLYKTLASALSDPTPFTHAIFCTNVTFTSHGYPPELFSINYITESPDIETLSVQRRLANTWKGLDPSAQISVVRTIEDAVALVRTIATEEQEQVACLVTGSVHLVGGFLEVLETQTQD